MNAFFSATDSMTRESTKYIYGFLAEQNHAAWHQAQLYIRTWLVIIHLLDYNNLQLKQQIDLLRMQGGSKEVTTPKLRSKFTKTAIDYSRKAQKLGIKTALYMTHAYLDNDPRYEPNLIKKIELAYYGQ